MILVVKIGTSSVTGTNGLVDEESVKKLCGEVARARRDGHDVLIVTSGAVTAGLATLGLTGERPSDPSTLRSLSAIGQHRLMRVYDDAFADEQLVAGQVLFSPYDFGNRHRYLTARATLVRMLELGVVPIVNENDPIADDELRFGDNDRLAALVANLLGAELLVLLTDTPGLFDSDPRIKKDASLVEEVTALDGEIERAAGGAGSTGGSGGMAAKLAAARLAAWSGVRVVIAAAYRQDVLCDAILGTPGVGTVFPALEKTLSARKLWIAFARSPTGRVVVDAGARRALVSEEASLLPAGVRAIEGNFAVDDVIEVVGEDGNVFAKGIARLAAEDAPSWLGRRTADLAPVLARELVHRDDLVVLVGALSHR
jgi:glutamate 5-kinase